ncbi:MAG: VOC family protein [Acidobacteria bacterium]|nr:VOC family protein [Acidobacteriota bacterium]MBI3281473.1 VOC family protein [Acidobacteriota bacterium]
MTNEFALNRVSVIMLGVRDLERSLAFYRDRLGLNLKNQIPGFAFLDSAGTTLCLSEPLGRTAAGQIAGATEVVFGVESVRAAYEALRARGVSFLNEPRNVSGPMWAAAFTDPDGHKLSVFGPE